MRPDYPGRRHRQTAEWPEPHGRRRPCASLGPGDRRPPVRGSGQRGGVGMRLGEWQSRSPNQESMAAKVLAPATEALALLGADPDPECWISWGDDPGARYAILALTPAGLALVNVRVNVPGEGPRVAGKL